MRGFSPRPGKVARPFGFLHLVGHGISKRVTQSMVGHVPRFFAPMLRDKLATKVVNSPHFRAYMRPRFGHTRGEQNWCERVDIADAPSLEIHPASMMHRQLDRKEQLAPGVAPGYIRLSIGIEHAENIIGDFAQILDAAGGATNATAQQKAA